MSTEETSTGEEEAKSESKEEETFESESIEEVSIEEAKSESKEELIESESITETIVPQVLAIKLIEEEEEEEEDEDYDFCSMTDNSYTKMGIPSIKAGISAADFALKEVSLMSAFCLKNCEEFYDEAKQASLPATAKPASGSSFTDDQKDALKRHQQCLSILTMACNTNVTLMSYIVESKDTDWPSGQMHLIVRDINQEYKDSGLGVSESHARNKQANMIRDIKMNRNDDPNILFESLAGVKLVYTGTKIPLTDQKMKDAIYSKLPSIYDNTLANAETLWKVTNLGEEFTYKVMKQEVRKAYKISQKNVNTTATKEVVLYTGPQGRGEGRGKGRGGGRGRGRGTQGRGRGRGRGGGGGGGNNYKCHYCNADHLKRNCAAYKKERSELWCNHCSTGGHDDGMCFKLHPDRKGFGIGGNRQYSKFAATENPQGGGDEASAATVDVILCVVDMSGAEEDYKDGEYDSSNQVVTLNINDEFNEEDIMEVFNEDGIVEWNSEYTLVTNELLSFPSSTRLLLKDSMAVADTGSTTNVSGSKRGATNIIKITYGNKEATHDASGNDLQVKMIYDLKCMFTDRYGNDKLKATVTRFRYAPNKPFTLLAINKFMEEGWILHGSKYIGIKLSKNGNELIFDIPIRTKEGVLWCVNMKRLDPGSDLEANEVNLVSISIKKAHSLLGHMNEEYTRKAAAHLGMTVTRGSLGKCESCAIGKARQKNIGKGDDNPPTCIGELWYIDGLSIKQTKKTKGPFPSNNKAVMMTEHKTGTGFLGWFNTKDGFINDYIIKMNVLKDRRKYSFKRLRADGAGENKSFVNEANGKQWKFTIVPEWTARATPQANLVENPIFVCTMRARTLQAEANVPDDMKNITFPLAYKFASQTRALEVIDIDGSIQTRHEHLFGSLPNYASQKCMRTWGEAVTIKVKGKQDPKSKENGITCMFGCYSEDRSSDCYTCFDPKTLQSYHSRDATWMNRMYFGRDPKVPRTGRVLQIEGLEDVIQQGSVVDGVAEAILDDEDSINSNGNNEDSINSNGNNENENENETASDAILQSPRITTRGSMPRTIRPQRHADGTEIRNYGLAALVDIEEAIGIEDTLLEDTYALGYGEISLICGNLLGCPEDVAEVCLHTKLDPDHEYDYIEQAFGYTNDNGKMLVAAFMKKDEEYYLVGATGHNYGNTKELQVKNYHEAMASIDKEEWKKAIKMEYEKMQKYNVFKVVNRNEVPSGTKFIDFTWAMKKKASGVYRARLAARGFKQVEDDTYQKDDTSSPVISEMAIRIIMVLIILGNWSTNITDVEGAFLNGKFERKTEKLYGKVPQGFENEYLPGAVLLFLQCLYGTIQGALQWFRECCMALSYLKWTRSKADPCLSYKWADNKLVIFLLWVDDCLIAGQPKDVINETKQWRSVFDTTDEGPMKEYVGCKIDRTKNYIRCTQPVKIQRLQDEFGYTGEKARLTPAKPGSVLTTDALNDKEEITDQEQTRYRMITGMLNHMVRWSRLDCQNPTRESSQFMKKATRMCISHLDRLCNFIVSTKERGYTIRPDNPGSWDGTRDFLFYIEGESDSNYAKDHSRRSVNGGCTRLNGALIRMFCKMMPIVALSTTEAELFAGVLEAQDMMFAYHIMTSMLLTVELPMLLYIDNQGTVDLANNWSVGGRTRHVDVKQNYLRELKEKGFIRVLHRSGTEITPDISTKNTDLNQWMKQTTKFMSYPGDD